MPTAIAKTRDGIGRGNTKVWNDNGHFAVQLHNTVVYDETSERIVLATGGWVTQTTARRINQALQHRKVPGAVRIIRGEMYFQSEHISAPFVGGVYVLNLAQPVAFDEVGAIIAYENGELAQDATIELFQHLIDNGPAWSLQGHYGRTARALIDAGHCRPAEVR